MMVGGSDGLSVFIDPRPEANWLEYYHIRREADESKGKRYAGLQGKRQDVS